MINSCITVERLMDVLEYNKGTGVFIWKVNRGAARQGVVAGYLDHEGYTRISVFGKAFRAHRLAWLFCNGVWPRREIDHKDGDKGNNRIGNLRDVCRLTNSENARSARKHNKCGFLGVRKSDGRFVARIAVHGKHHQVGRYDTPEEAYAAYLDAKRALHQGCTI